MLIVSAIVLTTDSFYELLKVARYFISHFCNFFLEGKRKLADEEKIYLKYFLECESGHGK